MNEKEKKDREIVERIIERNGNCDFIMYFRDCPLNECQDYCGEGENTKLAEQWLSDHPEKTPTEEKINNLETVVCTLDEKYNRLVSDVRRIERVLNNKLLGDNIRITGKSPLDVPETLTESLDPITNEVEPEVIGDYMHYQGEDYYRFHTDSDYAGKTCAFCDLKKCLYNKIGCSNCYWKNIKDIEITDEIAKRRPWVIGEGHVPSKLLYFENGHAVTLKGNQEEMYNNVMCMYHHDNVTIATTEDLRKAGIEG